MWMYAVSDGGKEVLVAVVVKRGIGWSRARLLLPPGHDREALSRFRRWGTEWEDPLSSSASGTDEEGRGGKKKAPPRGPFKSGRLWFFRE